MHCLKREKYSRSDLTNRNCRHIVIARQDDSKRVTRLDDLADSLHLLVCSSDERPEVLYFGHVLVRHGKVRKSMPTRGLVLGGKWVLCSSMTWWVPIRSCAEAGTILQSVRNGRKRFPSSLKAGEDWRSLSARRGRRRQNSVRRGSRD